MQSDEEEDQEVKRDLKAKADRSFRQVATWGHPVANYNVAMYFVEASLKAVSDEKKIACIHTAFQFFKTAVENGHDLARLCLQEYRETAKQFFKDPKDSAAVVKIIDDILSVANSAPMVATCTVCNKQAKFVCSRCKLWRYCSAECQKKHWSTHKKCCKS